MDQEINRGELARQVLDNPIYQEAITATKASLVNSWAGTKWFERKKRERLWAMMRQAEALQAHIEKVMQTGRMAKESQINRQRLKNVI